MSAPGSRKFVAPWIEKDVADFAAVQRHGQWRWRCTSCHVDGGEPLATEVQAWVRALSHFLAAPGLCDLVIETATAAGVAE